MKEIILTQGKKAIVDDEDFEFLNQYDWCVAMAREKRWGYKAVKGFTYSKNGKKQTQMIQMHRIIMLSPPDIFDVDHIDGNSLNNQKSNLRICTHAENMMNIRRRVSSSSRFRGVTFNKQDKRWRARFFLGGKSLLDKKFNKEEEAALIYNEFCKKYHGEFARLNIISK